MEKTTGEYRHIPVLLDECLEQSRLKPQHTFVDATLGGAGHSSEVARRLGPQGLLIGIDQDDMALTAAGARLKALGSADLPRIELLRGNFGNLDELLLEAEVPGIDAILFDLGVSSPQLDFPSRGFSFKEDAPLDMRMDPGNQTTTAAELVNTLDAAELARIIRDYSDEKWASRIAQFIVAARERAPIETSGQLVEIDQGRHSRFGASCGRPSRQKDVPGAAHRSELRAFGFAQRLGSGGALAESERPHPGDQLPFP